MNVKITKNFQTRLMALKTSGKKIQYQQSMTVLNELQLEVDISKSFRKETRIPNCYKYELPEGYRIVFQKVEGAENCILALFIGSHADTDHFLNMQKGWIFDPESHRLKELNMGTVEREQINVVNSPELRDKKPLIEQPRKLDVFGEMTKEMLNKAGVSNNKVDQALSFTDPDSLEVMEFLDSLNQRTADILLTYLTGDKETRNEIIGLLAGKRIFYTHLSSDLVEAFEESSEEIIELRELKEAQIAFESLPIEDWMLFLHPDQKSFVIRDFSGPVRLRGVSGSGKTVVAIHKARQLAREVIQEGSDKQVLFLTFNRSLADLVLNLINQFCLTAEKQRIQVSTIDKWCKDFLKFRLGNVPTWDNAIVEEAWLDSFKKCMISLKSVGLCNIQADDFRIQRDKDAQFLKDEVEFIFGKFTHSNSELYLTCDRRGRIRRLTNFQRMAIIQLYNTYVEKLAMKGQFISKELNRNAYKLLKENEILQFDYKGVIVDEVQDLSEIELLIIKELASRQNNKLYLVGDGAQRIYTRGYSMKNLGINVVGRSFVLKKNYRNTREIMKTASFLMAAEGIGKFDEEPEVAQTIALQSSHSGERPLLMIAKKPSHEWETIAREIRYLVKDLKIPPHEICCLARADWERNGIKNALSKRDIKSIDYKAEGIVTNDCIKISSLHNVKGHEFRIVFIAGLYDGAIPLDNAYEEEDIEKEAALLYVAITRAKEFLYLSYPLVDQSGRSLEQSRFIKDMEETLDVIELLEYENSSVI